MSSVQKRRLPQGGLIDRTRPLRFSFEGRDYEGYEGDTLASALMANGVKIVGRSFKYHRPRGLLAAGAEEPNALVRVGEGARASVNLRATEVLLYDGLVARAVNCWPSARLDLGAVNGLFSRFLAAGFYYKTFMWPSWHAYEWAIRRAAGLGKPAHEPDPDSYDQVYAHCDVLVIGAGAAGLAAARAAGSSGARVILAEQDFALGGGLLWDDATIDDLSARDWLRSVEATLRAQPETRILPVTTALGYFDHNTAALVERVASAKASGPRERMWQVRAKRVVLATGATERPLVFGGNDRPGIMLSSAVRHYLHRYGVRPADRAVVLTNNDDAYKTAIALANAGIEVACVADLRSVAPAAHVQELGRRGIEVFQKVEILGTEGTRGLRAVRIRANGRERRITCDLLAMSGGTNPSIHLYTQSGGRPSFNEALACFVPGRSVQAEESVGAAAGVFSLARSLEMGHDAGARAARDAGFGKIDVSAPVTPTVAEATPIAPFWGPVKSAGKAFVDFQNDVSASDIALAARENFVSVEHLKRYTTLGMAPDQGKTSNVNALAMMAKLTGRGIAQTGTTRNRFPYTPVSIGAFNGLSRGACLRPFRRMPLHNWHAAHGARFEDYGSWMRPAYYLRAGETARDAEQREARAVREAVGLFEGTPLGKIEIRGPDAAKFLDRLYANTISTLKTGKVRYGIMLNELGVVIDDGVVARFADDHFLVGTTGAGAARIAGWIDEWLQCEWPDLDVIAAPVTTSWAVLTVTGPRARDMLTTVGTDVSLTTADFPHMSFKFATVGGVAARIMRVSFTGEASYELNVPAHQASTLWQQIMDAGEAHGIMPIGIDAWMLLRTEKGYFHIGADTDGTTVPNDLGWGQVARKASDFIGKRSLSLPNNVRPGRPQLVGLHALDSTTLPIGAHLCLAGQARASEGYVTSTGFSPILRQNIALAMVNGGRDRMGEELHVYANGRTAGKARVVAACHYDPKGERLHA